MTGNRIVVGTRGSKLALWQANHVADAIRAVRPEMEVMIEVIHTTGDKIRDVALSKIGDKGLFTKELERVLIAHEIDVCVHSMKDVPTTLPEGLVLAAMLQRADARDVLVSSSKTTFSGLPSGSRVGTGALRRRAQLQSMRDDLEYVEARGNLDTRIKRAVDGDLDAIVLAASGIERMGWTDVIAEYLDPHVFIPAVGQGAIGMEIREDDTLMQDICADIASPHTMYCIEAERYIMHVLEGGCQVPIGAYARFEDHRFVIDAMVASLDGSKMIRSRLDEAVHHHGEYARTSNGAGRKVDGAGRNIALASKVSDDLIAQGAVAILDEVRAMSEVSDAS